MVHTMTIYHIRFDGAEISFTNLEQAEDFARYVINLGVNPVEQWTSYRDVETNTADHRNGHGRRDQPGFLKKA